MDKLHTNSETTQFASIKVIGVGGAGNNAVGRMIETGLQGVEFYVANTDMQVLNTSKAKNKLILGKEITKGLGAGANPEIGEQAALESEAEIKKALHGADLVFIAAGMGGGTGSGAAHVVARIAKELGAATIAIITKPFTFEGRQRAISASEGIINLRKQVDWIFIISNDKLLEYTGNIPLKDAFKEADSLLRQGVQMITDLIAAPALINLDFADLKTLLQNKGNAFFGIGIGDGDKKAEKAAKKAICSPLLDEVSIKGTKNLILNVTGGETVTLIDAHQAVAVVREATGNDVNIIFGVAINESLQDEMIVTIIAAGYDENKIEKSPPFIDLNQQLKINDFASHSFAKTQSVTTPDSLIHLKQTAMNATKVDKTSDLTMGDDDLPVFLRRKKDII